MPTKFCVVKAMVFPVVVYGCESWSIKKAEHQELMLSNCGAGEGSRESLGFCKIQPLNPKGNQPWIFIGRTDAGTEALILWPPFHQKRPWCQAKLKARREGDNRGQDAWMASLTQRTWVWANSRRWWRTDKPGVLQSMGPQRVGHDLATKQKKKENQGQGQYWRLNMKFSSNFNNRKC